MCNAKQASKPYVGLATMSEMVMNAQYVSRAVNVPVLCDADTGYSNAINVVRTVEEFEGAGIARIQLEDQVAFHF